MITNAVKERDHVYYRYISSSRTKSQPKMKERSLYEMPPVVIVGRDSKVRRVFDVVSSIFIFLLTAPLFLFIMVLVKLGSRGPIFYTQTRVGINRRLESISPSGKIRAYRPKRNDDLGGRPFSVIKFRSMRMGAEADGQAVWAKTNDSRITAVGNILRKTHLDELPQLLNILRGEMSLVGPRPERPDLIRQLRGPIPGYDVRLVVKPGVTGLAQIRHPADQVLEDVRKKIRYDLFYIKKRSLWTDLYIILKTIPFALGLSAEKFTRLRFRKHLF